jgi:glycogen phosphorylase
MVQDVFHLKGAAGVANRVAFVEDYDLALAAELVAGCDLWVNLPRPPQEASGTSGMKSCMNGGLQLSVLDGWWAEAHQGDNGWAIEGSVSEDSEGQDRSHARCLFDLLERDVSPLFNDRGPDGIPTTWMAMIKRSMRTNCVRFSAARMLDEYAERIWS